MTMTQGRTHLPALTGLRFVAALHVVLYHTALSYLAGAPGWVRGVVGSGYVGVSLFFVLSGFILAYNYLDRPAGGRVRARPFWAARFARVYPVFLAGLLLGLPFFVEDLLRYARGVAGAAWWTLYVLSTLSLTQAWLPRGALLWNGPAWSLSTEAFFYLLFPLVAGGVLRLRRRHLLPLCAALWGLTFVAPALYVALNPDGLGTADPRYIAPWLGVVKFNPLVRLPEFLMGVLLGRWFVLRRGALLAASDRVVTALTLGVAGVIGAVLVWSAALPYVFLHNALLAPAFAALIVLLALGRGPLARLLSGSAAARLGEASYALYIVHLPLFGLLGAAAAAWAPAWQASPLFLAGYLAGAIALSVVILRRVEEPARRWLRGRLSPPRGSVGIAREPVAAAA